MEVRVELEIPHTRGFDAHSPRWWVAEHLGMPEHDVLDAWVRRRALDARRARSEPTWQLTIDARLQPASVDDPRWGPIPPPPPAPESPRYASGKGPVIVVGAGPAGLFAALHLAEHGAPVILLERGRPVETRARDFGRFRGRGELDPESNLCFGEGGAGTYSDGKLTCRRKDPLRTWVLQRLVDMGGPERILSDAKPHIGTNLLFRILKGMRRTLLERGVQLEFGTRVTELIRRGGRVRGVRVADGRDFDGSAVLLAVGHSARDLFEALDRQGLPFTAKGFAVGVRIEHPQAWLDQVQYRLRQGAERPSTLPPADYRLAHTADDRGIYSFCMCPGGMVVPTATEPETVVVNGMSSAKRGTPFANSGFVTQVEPEDLIRLGYGTDPLSGIRFQHQLERRAYQLGGGGYRAPAMSAQDFLRGRSSGSVPDSHFRPGLQPADLNELLPRFATDALRHGLQRFDRRLRGYAGAHATLIGVESRTSSPVRIERHPESHQVHGWPGLYVAGEGPGYAGGIMSAALDGLRVAGSILRAD
jgi:hypothetical protein